MIFPQYDYFLCLTTMRSVAFATEPRQMPFGEVRSAPKSAGVGESRDTFRLLKDTGMNALKGWITIVISAARSPAA